jgi:hypothetical protein
VPVIPSGLLEPLWGQEHPGAATGVPCRAALIQAPGGARFSTAPGFPDGPTESRTVTGQT